jgi:hypothetical protein
VTPPDSLIDISKHERLLNEWFEERLAELKRVYRASDHEFTLESYKANCNDKGMTLTAIQAENGRIFGGFTTKNLIKSGNGYTEDDKAWIFSIDHGTKHKVK